MFQTMKSVIVNKFKISKFRPSGYKDIGFTNLSFIKDSFSTFNWVSYFIKSKNNVLTIGYVSNKNFVAQNCAQLCGIVFELRGIVWNCAELRTGIAILIPLLKTPY